MLIKAKLIQVAGQEPGFGESEGSDWYQIDPKWLMNNDSSTLASGIDVGPTFINFWFFFQALWPY